MPLANGFLSYEDARAVVEAAPKGILTLPSYTGGSADLSYLHQYVAQNAAKLYGVSASVFNTATVFSTTLLRDFVHRAVYDNNSHLDYNSLGTFMTTDVAAALRYPAYGICGLLGWQMYTVFSAFGYQTTRISSIDTAWARPSGPVAGHVTTEVFLQDYGKFALQDATYNTIWLNAAGVPQNYQELRTAVEVNHQTINPVYDTSYVNAQVWGGPLASLPNSAAITQQIDDLLRKTWFQVPYTWTTSFNNFSDFTTFVDMTPGQGRQFASVSAALADFATQHAVGATWQNAAHAIRAHHDVTGFQILSPDSGQVTGDWLTVKIAGGTYLTYNLDTGQALNGTLDQLLAEGSGRGPIMNPGVNLAAIFGPTVLMNSSGTIGLDWAAQRLATVAGTAYGAVGVVVGTTGDDILNGGTGAQLHVGGAGNDTYYIDNPNDLVMEYAGGGYDRVFTSVSYTLSPNTQVEYLAASAPLATTPINLTGNKYTNTIVGNAGNNMLNGNGGADVMIGGQGNDTYFVDNPKDIVVELPGQGYDRVFTSVSYKLPANASIEELNAMTSTDTKTLGLTGNTLSQKITGNAGNDLLNDGGGAADTLVGLGGNDTYLVNNGADKVVEAVNGGFDAILTTQSFMLAEDCYVEVLRAVGKGALALIGNSHQNTIIGNAANNVINGQGGGDLMRGMGGDDTYHVWSANDTVIENKGQGFDTVITHVSWQATPGSEIEKIVAADTAPINITGNEFANIIIGNSAANILDGGLGNDTLTGGGGADVFQFSTPFNAATNVDTITDFTPGIDQIWIKAALLNGVAVATGANGVLDASAFVIGTVAANSDQHVIYDDATGNLYFDDGASEVQFAKLAAHLALSNTDFKIV